MFVLEREDKTGKEKSNSILVYNGLTVSDGVGGGGGLPDNGLQKALT